MSEVRPLHFVTLVGSLRKASLNAALARALPALAPAGVSIEALASIGDLPHYDADVQEQGFPAAVTAMGQAIKRADGVIVVMPEYNYSVPGALKNALDWLSRLPETPFSGKPLAIQSASPGMLGGSRAQYHLRQSMVFLNAQVLNKPEVMISQAVAKIDVAASTISDEKTREVVARQIEALATLARHLYPA